MLFFNHCGLHKINADWSAYVLLQGPRRVTYVFVCLFACCSNDHFLIKKQSNHGTEEPCIFILSLTMTNDHLFTL